MRIVSLLPAATEIVVALGLGDELVGRSEDAEDLLGVADVPVVAFAAREAEPDGAAAGPAWRPLRLDGGALATAAPDLIIAAGLPDLGGVTGAAAARALEALEPKPELVTLQPTSLEGILNAITTVGAMVEAEDEAIGLVELLRERLAVVEDRVLERRLQGVPPRRVACLEWLDPPFAAGRWIPEQVRRAGGWELLGREGEPAAPTSWEALRDVDPEQLFLMLRGMDAAAAAAAWADGVRPPWFGEVRAARHGELFALDAGAYFSRPGPRVVEGVALLAELLDPRGFEDETLGEAWIPLSL